ncbi:PilZ domain-containing protein [Planococcus chinensis]|uniref:PilZ domain-containing protein n=1 Tax=Planococcus chinensis TaxID=272917 RepID=A0ABW4QET9_9BACL
MNENRREFFRVFLQGAVGGKIAIGGGELQPIDIEDISVKGLRFLYEENIPMDEKVAFSFEILDKPFFLEGTIVRKQQVGDKTEYGAGFEIDQPTASHLFKQLNYYQIRQRKGVLED